VFAIRPRLRLKTHESMNRTQSPGCQETEIGYGQEKTAIIDNPVNKGFNFCQVSLSS
jgi:hypothetical protein